MGRSKKDRDSLMKLLALIGGILLMVVAMLFFISVTPNRLINQPPRSVLPSIANGIIFSIIGLIVLFSCIKPNDPIPFNEVFMIIMGVISIVLSVVLCGIGLHTTFILAFVGGNLILLGGILGLVT